MSMYATYHDGGNEPPSAIPAEFVAKMREAKQWYDDRTDLEAAIERHRGIAERNQEDRDASDRVGAAILDELVEMAQGIEVFTTDAAPQKG